MVDFGRLSVRAAGRGAARSGARAGNPGDLRRAKTPKSLIDSQLSDLHAAVMGALRTLLALSLLCTGAAAAALPQSATERAELFAVCAGTWRAEAEHRARLGPDAGRAGRAPRPARLRSAAEAPRGPEGGADSAAARAAAFAGLLDAVRPDAQAQGLDPVRLRAVRVQAWLEHRARLDRTVFAAPDPGREAAGAAAARRRARCDALLLGA